MCVFFSVLLNYAVYLFGSFGFVCFELSIAVFLLGLLLDFCVFGFCVAYCILCMI